MLTATGILNLLRRADLIVGDGRFPILRIDANDDRIDWSSFPPCSNGGWPGLNFGQSRDCRYSTDGEDSLHVEPFDDRGYVEIHRDRGDVCRDAAAHAVRDTRLIEGLILGGLLFCGVGALAAGVKGALIGLAAGGAAGGTAGVYLPRAPRLLFTPDSLVALVRRSDAAQSQRFRFATM